MDRDKQQDEERPEADRREEGQEARREMDEVPPPGTDPLHEGP